MYRVKVQLNYGKVQEVDVAKLIIESTGINEDEEIHLIATNEGVIVDVFDDDGECLQTRCIDPELLMG